ncbi:STAS/SEC14 domain-containing protein [Candidatus Marimicrobium litorale]|jgi:hypothetical protein|uniref:STAS/SEC14 domain-containing protein n=1 Tax=Candidatus Marimicrobium litorale TaxID=2518991 RepID=A0ABT3T772_9GAMM|nr:STAS/SEC14 domain-containing protein [Candidatus Marimicrobium litorale]MCX2977671.1 STAS/SEC14 domain-containing protein [Candidatus Marimicrobium litorale]
MIKELPESTNESLGFEISGKVSLEEGQKWIQRIEVALQTQKTLNVLVVLDDGVSWGVEAGIEDIKWVMAHMERISKFAIISSSRVWKWLVAIDGFFASMVGIEEKHFDIDDLPTAWDWIRDR